MTLLTKQNNWRSLSKDDKSFIYEMSVTAIGAIVLVALLG